MFKDVPGARDVDATADNVTSITPEVAKRRELAAVLASPLARADFGTSSAVWPTDVTVPQGDRHKRYAIPMSKLVRK